MAEEAFNEEKQAAIRNAIQQSELATSGEIKVHIENHCKEETLDRAAYIFEQLKMHETALRNGVLIYLAIKDRQFAIIGDIGINQKVKKGFWDSTSLLMMNYFKNGEFTKGLVEGILTVGQQLKTHFPYKADDQNELSDEISFGKDV
ncbi:MAG: hypothetical protein CMO34_06695 [Verrucomicrobia bacterium]|nr:hypothetical protein [Verrucomicrobiota bacterium]